MSRLKSSCAPSCRVGSEPPSGAVVLAAAATWWAWLVSPYGACCVRAPGSAVCSAEEEIIVALTRAIEDFNVVYKEHRAIRDLLKEQFIDHATKSYILGELFLTNVLAANQISIMKREIEAASFDYKSKDTLWEIYNHATLSLKEGHPANWVESHKKLSQTFKQWI